MRKDAITDFYAAQKQRIPNADHLPAYKIFELAIRAGIESNAWKDGEPLPPERLLAEACSLSVGTVKRAMLNLTHEGILYRRQGSGTFVSGTSFNRRHRRYFLRLKNFGGREARNAVSLHAIARVPAVPEINPLLSLPPDAELYEVVRVFREEGSPVLVTSSYLCAKTFHGLEYIPAQRFAHVPLFIMLEEYYKIATRRNEELFGVAHLPGEEAGLLEVPAGTPALCIKTLTYTDAKKPFEFRRSYCLTNDKFIHRAFE